MDGITDLRQAFNGLVKGSIEKDVCVILNELDTVNLKIRHIRASRAIRSDANRKNYNWLFMAANQRAVEDTPIDEAIGLKALNGEEVYVGCVYGEYLDQHVNQERTGISYTSEDGRNIRRSVMQSSHGLSAIRRKYGERKKRSVALKIVREEYPQFLYMQGGMKEFVEGLAPSATSKEQVFVEMCRNRFPETNPYNRLDTAIKKAPAYTTEVHEQIGEVPVVCGTEAARCSG